MADVTGLRAAAAARVVLLDGATGTELTRRGVPTALPLWSAGALLTHREIVETIHREYVEAGADIVVANTFRTNVRTLRAAGLLERGGELNAVAMALARRAAEQPNVRDTRSASAWVAASVAPVEDCYHPERVPDYDTLLGEHWQMMAWLRDAHAELVWIETMNTVREAKAAATAARGAGLEFAVSFVTGEGGDLLGGEPLEDAVAAIDALGPTAIGLNCIPPAGMTANLPRLAENVERRWRNRPRERPAIAAYAHIGNAEPIHGWSFSQAMSAEEYAGHARRWVELGATIVGGCCGTTPEHIRAMRHAWPGG